MTDLLRASDRARRTLARRLPILVGIVVVSACSYTPTSSGLPLTRPSASHAPSSLGTTAPQITPRPGETPRAETAGTGPTQETIDTSGVSPVFVIHAVCTPGASLTLELSGAGGDVDTIHVPCDQVVSSRTTFHDPSSGSYESLTVQAEGDGGWSVLVADTSQTIPPAE